MRKTSQRVLNLLLKDARNKKKRINETKYINKSLINENFIDKEHEYKNIKKFSRKEKRK